MPEAAGEIEQYSDVTNAGTVSESYLAPLGCVQPGPGAKIIKARDYMAFREAEGIVAAARAHADELLREAAEKAEEMRRTGYEEGQAEGRAEVAEQLFNAVTASVDQMASMEAAMVDLVLKSLNNVLGSFDDKELVTRVVSHALRLVRDDKRVVLRVSVDDAETVRSRLDEFLARYPGITRIDVVPDASLGRGGCIMETDAGVIDASLDRQLAIIEETLKRHLEERKM